MKNCYQIANIALIISCLFAGMACNPFEPDNPIPPDLGPSISLRSPENANLLLFAGDSIKADLVLADNEALDRLQIFRTIRDGSGQVIEDRNPIIDILLIGTLTEYAFRSILDSLPPYTKFTYQCVVSDTKGARAEAQFFLSVLPPSLETTGFQIFSFESISLSSKNSGANYGMNLTTSAYFPESGNNVLDMDIEEASDSDAFSATLISPNNETLGEDSIFVKTDAANFNFDAATHTTVSQLFSNAATHFKKSSSLAEGDILLIRLTKAPRPQFAVLRITEIVDDPGSSNDKMVFDYKVTGL